MAIDELDEHERSELVRGWLRQNASAILIGVAAGLALIVGYNQWQAIKRSHGDQAQAHYESLVAGIDAKDADVVAKETKLLREDYAGTPYAVFAALRIARDAVDRGEVDQALEQLTWARDHADAPALQLLGSILGDGESSRFNRRLVRQERAALGAGGFTNLRRMSSVGLYFAVANQGVSAERLEELLAEEVERVLREGVTPAEVTKAQNQYRAQAIHQRQTTMGVAETLQGALRYFGDLEAANRDVERFLAVTAQDIRRVAQTYLTGDNRLTVVVNPPAREGQ